MDVCPVDENLVATCGDDKNIKIFDRRECDVVQTFDNVHSSEQLTLFLIRDINQFSVFAFLNS